MEKVDTAEKKRVIMCRHYYKSPNWGTVAGYENFFKGESKGEVVHKHNVTITQRQEDGEQIDICNHELECTGRYFAVEGRRVDCPFKTEEE